MCHLCLPVAPLFLGLVALPSAVGSSAFVIEGFVYPKAAGAGMGTSISAYGGGGSDTPLGAVFSFVRPLQIEPMNLIQPPSCLSVFPYVCSGVGNYISVKHTLLGPGERVCLCVLVPLLAELIDLFNLFRESSFNVF